MATISIDAALSQIHLATMDGERAVFEAGKEAQDAAKTLRETTEKKLKDLEGELKNRNKDSAEHAKEGESLWESLIGSNRHEEEGKALESKVDQTQAKIEKETVSLTEAREAVRSVADELSASADKLSASFDTTVSLLDASSEAFAGIFG
jgi:predicted  nucleic acid-binding Zn-ribbon protein